MELIWFLTFLSNLESMEIDCFIFSFLEAKAIAEELTVALSVLKESVVLPFLKRLSMDPSMRIYFCTLSKILGTVYWEHGCCSGRVLNYSIEMARAACRWPLNVSGATIPTLLDISLLLSSTKIFYLTSFWDWEWQALFSNGSLFFANGFIRTCWGVEIRP